MGKKSVLMVFVSLLTSGGRFIINWQFLPTSTPQRWVLTLHLSYTLIVLMMIEKPFFCAARGQKRKGEAEVADIRLTKTNGVFTQTQEATAFSTYQQ